MTNICIFCNKPLDNSKEHIIPESLNGRLSSNEIICYSCNSKRFGKTIDPSAAELFKVHLHIFDAKNARKLHFEDPEGNKYLKDQKGNTKQVKTNFQLNEHPDGKIELLVSGDPKEVLKTIKKHASKVITKTKIPVHLEVTPLISDPPLQLEIDFQITQEIKLLVNKIILEFLALKAQDITSYSELYKRVHDLDQSLNNVFFLNFNQEVRTFGDEEISHLIVIQSIGNYLIGYLELFNVLCCAIIISSEYKGQEINEQFHQDALTGEIFKSLIDLKFDIKKILNSPTQPKSEEFSFLNEQVFERRIDRIFRTTRENGLISIIKELQEKYDQGEIDKTEFKKKYVKQSADLVAHLNIFYFPYSVIDTSIDQLDQMNFIHSNIREELYAEFKRVNKHLIGQKFQLGKVGLYSLIEFYSTHVAKFNGSNILKIYCILRGESDGKKIYLQFRRIFDAIEQAQPLNTNH
ncbi:HNH endonuclease [Jiulongibacter sediminis]|uniref:HNH endonuclease 5 domain-containing protein n=1 Tax=Jiulongibacter sediminis TaxID=1605367 RepID=A0A0P7BR45_9BACT|nr:HNH endonuclease [Jiulongibacter sediminis]KPM49714.1 hypothetical protein AFM12_03780 [Jiulongibacter sediminis]TBX26752.1 hypothetical protein TK44_03785 [Jiulongibacter sediminis]